MNSRFIRSLVLLVTIIALSWRFYDLDRDPVPVSASLSEVLDPAGYLYNARSFALTGDWRAEAYGHIFRIAPAFALLAGLWIKILGLGYGRIVLLSVFSGFVVIGCIAGMAEIAARQWGSSLPRYWAGIFALWSLGISYVFFALQQVPKGDMESMAVSAVAALLLVSLDGIDESAGLPLRAFIAGLGIGLAPLVKLHAAMFSAAALMAWSLGPFIREPRWRRTWKKATPYLFAGLLCTAFGWVPWYKWTSVHSFPTTTLAAPFGTSSRTITSTLSALFGSNLFYRHPVEIALAILAVAVYSLDILKNWSLMFYTLWFLFGAAIFSLLTYSPTRYRLLFVAPTVVLASHIWTGIATGRFNGAAKSWNVGAGTFGLLLFVFAEIYALQIRLNLGWSVLTVLALAAGCALPFAWIWRSIVLHEGSIVIANLIIVLMFVIALPQWIGGESHRDHIYQQLALTLVAKHSGLILGGDIGCQLALWTNEDCSMDLTESAKSPVTHLLLRESDNEITTIPQKFHEISRFKLPGVPEPVILLGRE